MRKVSAGSENSNSATGCDPRLPAVFGYLPYNEFVLLIR